jgi:hypothetical protein
MIRVSCRETVIVLKCVTSRRVLVSTQVCSSQSLLEHAIQRLVQRRRTKHKRARARVDCKRAAGAGADARNHGECVREVPRKAAADALTGPVKPNVALDRVDGDAEDVGGLPFGATPRGRDAVVPRQLRVDVE